jgi:hypothetical protein
MKDFLPRTEPHPFRVFQLLSLFFLCLDYRPRLLRYSLCELQAHHEHFDHSTLQLNEKRIQLTIGNF